MELVFATGNINKIREANDLLSDIEDISIVSLHQKGILEDIPETGDTLEDNARQKAEYIYTNYGYFCFSEDTGLEVVALHGKPGVLSARFAGPAKDNQANIDLLLKLLKGESNRTARFRTVICLLLEGKEYLFEGIVNGEILEKRRGTGGFGYDPVFKPEGYDLSFAEMERSSKTEISHRGIAVRKLVKFLSEQ